MSESNNQENDDEHHVDDSVLCEEDLNKIINSDNHYNNLRFDWKYKNNNIHHSINSTNYIDYKNDNLSKIL